MPCVPTSWAALRPLQLRTGQRSTRSAAKVKEVKNEDHSTIVAKHLYIRVPYNVHVHVHVVGTGNAIHIHNVHVSATEIEPSEYMHVRLYVYV